MHLQILRIGGLQKFNPRVGTGRIGKVPALVGTVTATLHPPATVALVEGKTTGEDHETTHPDPHP